MDYRSLVVAVEVRLVFRDSKRGGPRRALDVEAAFVDTSEAVFGREKIIHDIIKAFTWRFVLDESESSKLPQL